MTIARPDDDVRHAMLDAAVAEGRRLPATPGSARTIYSWVSSTTLAR